MNASINLATLPAEVQAYIASLQAKAAAPRTLSLKVSEKGAVSLYGMGRFPVTLYGEQWLKLLDMAVVIRDFVEANKSLLSVKGEAKAS